MIIAALPRKKRRAVSRRFLFRLALPGTQKNGVSVTPCPRQGVWQHTPCTPAAAAAALDSMARRGARKLASHERGSNSTRALSGAPRMRR